MTEKQFVLPYVVYDSVDEMEPADANLLREARLAARNAYSPYSHFSVGAALLLDNGVVVHGSNIENAAYPSGLCAERVAFFSAQSNYPDNAPVALALTAFSPASAVTEPVSPCGACRQVMVEAEQRYGRRIRIMTQGQTGKIMLFDGVGVILPFVFTNLYE